MSETDLLKAFVESRSEEAFAGLVRRYAGLVYTTAKRRLANTTLAEDITQIVFIRFAKKPPVARNHAELAAWLHRTTVHVTIDLWRSESRRRARELEAVVMQPATPENENALWEDISPKLDDALNQLTDEDRQTLLLRFFNQKSMREVGTAMGISEDAAKMRVSRAVEKLRRQLGVGAAAGTAAMLGTLLLEHSVEAAPARLVSRLLAIKLPAAATMAGLGGILAVALRISKLKLASGAVALALITLVAVHSAHSAKPSPASVAAPDSQASTAPKSIAGPGQNQFNPIPHPSGFASVPSPQSDQAKILFHVVDAATGEPLAGAKIQGAYFGVGGLGKGRDFSTDSNGTAAIPEPAQGIYGNVFVAADGHVPKVVSFSGVKQTDYTMKLDPAMTADGLVVDSQGQPVSGVKIFIQGPGTDLSKTENVDFQTCPVTTRDDGTWDCSYIPRDYTNEIHFMLRKDGYAATYPWVPVSEVGLSNLVLVINRGFAVTGLVADTQNQPVANASIKVLTAETGKELSAKTDENGFFTLAGVAGDSDRFYEEPPLETNDTGAFVIRGLVAVGKGPMHVDLAIQADGFAGQTRTVELSGTTNAANFTLAPGNLFMGRVVDESGNPIPNAVVQTDWDNQGLRTFDWQTRTDVTGQFEWTSAPAGTNLYWFEADGYQPRRDVSLTADGSDHQITLRH